MLTLSAKSSADAYHDLQARLARYSSVTLTTVPTQGNAWEHEGNYGYLRPNKGFRQEPGHGFATDGRRSWGVELNSHLRRAKSNDESTYMGLQGFETFLTPEPGSPETPLPV